MLSVGRTGLTNGTGRPFNRPVDLHVLIGAVLIGAAVGFLSGAFGKGGSAVSTPLLHLIGVPALIAIASPLPATIPSTWLASRGYAQAGHIDRSVVRTGLIIGLPLTALGALLTRWIPGEPLVLATDAILLVLGLRVLFAAHEDDDGAGVVVLRVPSPHARRRRGRRGRVRPPRQQRRLPARAALHEGAAHARPAHARDVTRSRQSSRCRERSCTRGSGTSTGR